MCRSIRIIEERGTGFPIIVAHVELADILRICSIWPIRLDINLPCPSEEVEIIDKRTAHKDLGGLIHVGQFNALLQDFVLINIKIKLRNAWQPEWL